MRSNRADRFGVWGPAHAGDEKQRGPTIAETDAHSLLVWSMPELHTWRVLSGPGAVTFEAEDEAQTDATFSADGVYVLELSVDASGDPADTVVVTVPEPNAGVMLAASLAALAALGRSRSRDGSF